MALSRTLPNPADGGVMFGHIQEQLAALFARAPLVPTSITNTGNDYTIVVDPVLNAGLINGMSFWINPNVTNTGAARLRVTTAGTYYDLTDMQGNPLVDNAFDAAGWYLVTFLGGSFLCVNLNDISGYSPPDNITFTASATLDLLPYKSAKSPETLITIVVVGAGGSGARDNNTSMGGGQGGRVVMASFLLGELPDTIGITIGAGGVSRLVGSSGSGYAGGTTSFGSIISIPGGLGGNDSTTGFNGTLAAMTFDKSFTAFNLNASDSAGDGGDCASSSFLVGTPSDFWGSGGNGSNTAPTAGAAPGGGGGCSNSGASGAGGRGEIRIHID